MSDYFKGVLFLLTIILLIVIYHLVLVRGASAQEVSESLTPSKTCPPGQALIYGPYCTDADGSTFNCSICDYCGNGIPIAPEACENDGGNIILADGVGCSGDTLPVACVSCALQCGFCGNGFIDIIEGETCDDSADPKFDDEEFPDIHASNECEQCGFCGDGIENNNEACDDQNTSDKDTCNNFCEITICGDNVQQDFNGESFQEDCDGSDLSQWLIDEGFSPNDINCVSCDAFFCGDGRVGPERPFEECDIDNIGDYNGDGLVNTTADIADALADGTVCTEECRYDYTSSIEVVKLALAGGNEHSADSIDIDPSQDSDCEGQNVQTQRDNGDLIEASEPVIFAVDIKNTGNLPVIIHAIIDEDLATILGLSWDHNFLEADTLEIDVDQEVRRMLNVQAIALDRGHHKNTVQIEAEDTDAEYLVTSSRLDICVAGCGDGFHDTLNEQCDYNDPNSIPEGHDCSNQCELELIPICGDGIIQQPNVDGQDEPCDKDQIGPQAPLGSICANNDSLVGQCGSSDLCELLFCGDNKLTHGEDCDFVNGEAVIQGPSCDAPTQLTFNICNSDCTIGFCGDGVWAESFEACDASAAPNPIMSAQNAALGFTCSNDCALIAPPPSPSPSPSPSPPPPQCDYVRWDVSIKNVGIFPGYTKVHVTESAQCENMALYGQATVPPDGVALQSALTTRSVQYYQATLGQVTEFVGFFTLPDCTEIFHEPSGVICDGDIRIDVSPLVLNFGPEKPWTIVKFKLSPLQKDPWVTWKASSNRPLLVYDPEGRGLIKDGSQLFGNWTFYGTSRASEIKLDPEGIEYIWSDGFDALKQLDSNNDGWVRGYELEDLALWFDNNQNGISEPGEVRSLDQYKITALNTNFDSKEASGDIVSFKGFEQSKAGNTFYGQTIDWFSGVYPNKESAVREFMQQSQSASNPSHVQLGFYDLYQDNQYISDQLSHRFNNIAGQWYWHDPADPSYVGILVIDEDHGKLSGYTMRNHVFKSVYDDQKFIRYTINMLEGSKKTSNAQYDTFQMRIGKEDNFTESTLIYNKAEDTISAQSVASNQDSQLTYDWVAYRRKFNEN